MISLLAEITRLRSVVLKQGPKKGIGCGHLNPRQRILTLHTIRKPAVTVRRELRRCEETKPPPLAAFLMGLNVHLTPVE
jgi:hypothetical protein